ncbi:TPA: tape measure protein [Streptococcus pyogenes]|uniref:tape measure protein n=1 Tax=Streptococcus pyogenes TaxID=1314 RepID=UPI00109D67D3|nr:tape measure protein [Streptococcus pyogenes]VGW14812.1 phage minor tail protein [Streptococcus pyogenes]VGW23733.1 phage minor tail protein [Streptococcus pyogenes]HEQ9810683.1 tape measure protein [Streptococcus pyogenes]HER5554467.1 tape measure protein [Streptococcus pyogenes]HES8779220.1 tape measure protein [Streptococcus pyogenes]
MPGTFDGSIFADVGANTKDYEQAMARIVSTTQNAFRKAQDTAVNSSNKMVQIIGQIMAQLANNGESLGKRLGSAYATGLKLSIGEIQRIAASIGEKIPEPIKNGFQKIIIPVASVIDKIRGNLTGFINQTKMQLQNLVGIGKIRSAFAKAATGVDILTQRASSKLNNLSAIFETVAGKLPRPFGTAFRKIASSVSTLNSSIQSVGGKISNSLGQQVLNPALQSWNNFFSSVSAKASAFANKVSTSLFGRLTSSLANLSSKIGSSLSNGFSRMSSSAATSLNGISQKFANTSSAGERLKSTVMSIVQAFSLMAVAQKAMHAITGAIDGAVSRVDTMNRFPKTMALFGYSAEQSKASIDKLSKGIEGLPTPLDSAVKSAQQLAITTGSLDKGTSLALAFNNAMIGYGATTEGAEQALRQFNQSLGSGKIQAEEFNSVSEAAPGLMSKMAEAFGFGKNGVQDLKSALSDGKITAQEFADKMIELNDAQGGFAEMAQSSAGGIRTAWKNVHTAVVKGVAGMISAFDEAAKANGMKTIAETLLSLKPAITSVFDTINSLIPNAVAAFARLKQSINIDFSPLGASVKEVFALINIVFGDFAHTGELSEQAFDNLKAKITSLAPKVIALWAVMNPASAISTIMPLLSLFGKVGLALGSLGTSVGAFGGIISSGIASASGVVGAFAATLSGLPGVFATAAGRGLSVLGTMTSAMSSLVSLALAAIGPAAILGLVVAGLGLINSQFGAQIDQLLNTAVTKGPGIIQGLVKGITSKIPALIASGTQLIAKFANAITVLLPVIIQAGVQLITSLVQGIGQNATSLISSAIKIIGSFVSSIASALPQLISVGMELLLNVVNGIVQNIPLIIQQAQQIIDSFGNSLQANLPSIISHGIAILVNLVQGITQMLPTVLQIATQVITSFVSGIVQFLPQLLQGGIQIIISLVQGIIQNLPQIVQSAVQIIQSLVSGLTQALPQIIAAGIQLVVQLAVALIKGLPQIISAGIQLITGLGKAMLEAIPNALSGVWEGIKSGFSSMWDQITGKSSTSTAKVSADATAMALNVGTQTTAMANQANTDTTSMLNSISQNTELANINATTQAREMASGVNGATSSMNLDAINHTLSLASGVGANMGAASTGATSQAQAMSSGVSNSLASMQSNSTKAASGLSNSVTSEMSSAATSATSSANRLSSGVESGFNKAKTSATTSINGIANAVKTGFSSINSTAKQSMVNLVSSVTSGMSRATAVSNNACQKILSIFRALAGQMSSAGAYAGQGFANGLASSAGTIYAIANSIAANVAATIRRALDIHSPSRVTKTLGAFTGEGFALGMAEWIGEINSLGKAYATAVTDQNWGVNSTVSTSAKVNNSGINTSLDNLSEEVRQSQLSEPIFEVHNEIVGDKIYTAVKEKESREQSKDSYFVFD